MELANGLYIYLPSKENFVYPAGDKACPKAIGRVIKDSNQSVCSSCERADLMIGYIEKATRASGAELEIGGWVITKIQSAKFKNSSPGEVEFLKVDIRGPGTRDTKKIRGVTLRTTNLAITRLFQE